MEKLVLMILLFVGLLMNFSTAQLNNGCLTPNSERATCVYLTDCTYLNNLLRSPDLSNSDRSYLRSSQCGYFNGQVLICCPNRYRNKNQPTSSNSVRPPVQSTSTNTRGSSSNLIPKPPTCGNIITNRIIGGNLTKIDEYPWMALIEYTKPGNNVDHHCAGSLITSRYVITAGHCINGQGIPSTWRVTGVRLGEWDTTTNPDCEIDIRGHEDCAPSYVDVPVERIITHPSYNSNTKNQLNDIALLRLKRSVSSNDFIRPICLPTATNLRSSNFENVAMDVAGWGKTEKGYESTVKLKATIIPQSLNDCKRKYGARNINLENSQICAGGEKGIDSCRGDSGGPLIGIDTESAAQHYFFLAGVVSFGPTPCGLEGWPGIYTRVGHYVDWIQQNIQP